MALPVCEGASTELIRGLRPVVAPATPFQSLGGNQENHWFSLLLPRSLAAWIKLDLVICALNFCGTSGNLLG